MYLHSTMFLLIRKPYLHDKALGYYLHSTMFLLIRSRLRSTYNQKTHLHSTMFLLIRFLMGIGINVQPDLHSTMFLLIHFKRVIDVKVSQIYIPLCFYLYYSGGSNATSLRLFTFHYVSTYTYHSILVQTNLRIIYIPLCFYLYSGVTTVSADLVEFTFHYVSTYTHFLFHFWSNSFYLHSTMFLLIPIVQISEHCHILDLHSTMFLLILTISSIIRNSPIIYIPLCFYLYCTYRAPRLELRNLHSTMFLLIRYAGRRRQYHVFNLHSTMFLLIHITDRAGAARMLTFTFHYVSTYTKS